MGDTAVIAAQTPEEAAYATIWNPGGSRRAGSDYRRPAQPQVHRVSRFCIDRARRTARPFKHGLRPIRQDQFR
jgi:hypothetical protein